MTSLTWQEHQDWERDWWGDCVNTYSEETKQLSYAHRMGLLIEPDVKQWPIYDMGGRSVIDLGGGPASMLLKTRNLGDSLVIDPQDVPKWVLARYEEAGIEYVRATAEDVEAGGYDEAWIYNVLQHVRDPEAVVSTATKAAAVVRLFEWVDSPPHLGHPHELKREDLERWLGQAATRSS